MTDHIGVAEFRGLTRRRRRDRLGSAAKRTAGYASRAEARRGAELELLERAGAIRELRKQVTFRLCAASPVGGGVSYRADFVYVDVATGRQVVEDVKGYRTELYRVKRQWMYVLYGVVVRECPA